MQLIVETRPGKYLAWSIQVVGCGYYETSDPEAARKYSSLTHIKEDYENARYWSENLPRTYKLVGQINGELYRITKIRAKQTKN